MHRPAAQVSEVIDYEFRPYVETSGNGHESASLSTVLADYYRCLPDMHVRSVSQSVRQSGYFCLGPDTICYGRLASGNTRRTPVENLENALEGVTATPEGIELPFHAAEVVENLRRERYAAHFRNQGRVLNDLLRKSYYLIRPCLGPSARRRLQKLHLRG